MNSKTPEDDLEIVVSVESSLVIPTDDEVVIVSLFRSIGASEKDMEDICRIMSIPPGYFNQEDKDGRMD